jgi:hypothetical protein
MELVQMVRDLTQDVVEGLVKLVLLRPPLAKVLVMGVVVDVVVDVEARKYLL